MSALTRSLTQKIILPLRIFSSSSSDDKKRKESGEISRKKVLLDDKIIKMHLGFEKIGLPIHGFSDTALFLPKIFLPSRTPLISGKKWLHASLLLETQHGYSIVVEYGAYDGGDMLDKDKDSCTTYYWFPCRHGLRFAEMSYQYYTKYKLDSEHISVSKIIFPLECRRRMTLKEVLTECNEEKEWTCENYDAAFQNCQDFVATFIQVIGGYRREKTALRGLHNLSSANIPMVILNQIEKNEDDGWNTVGKVPVVGPIIGAFYGLFR